MENSPLWNATFNRRLIWSACWPPLTRRGDECMQQIVQVVGVEDFRVAPQRLQIFFSKGKVV
jgi:hypothetical protein